MTESFSLREQKTLQFDTSDTAKGPLRENKEETFENCGARGWDFFPVLSMPSDETDKKKHQFSN